MKGLQTSLRRRVRFGAILVTAPAILLLSSVTPASAKKGGNGGGPGNGGGEDPPVVPLVTAPVEYQITWLDWPVPIAPFYLIDVNASGDAVGWGTPTSTGKIIGILADAQGNLSDLNDVFAEALLDFPGWRYLAATQINANGDIAGVLVPQAHASGIDETIVVLGNIYTDPPILTMVDHIENDALTDIPDLNEWGDMLVHLRWPEDDPGEETGLIYLYPSPDSIPNTPELVPTPAGANTGIETASLNSNRQVMFTAEFTSITTTTRGKKTTTTETRAYHSYLWDTDGTLSDLGQVGGKWGNTATEISEEGYGYASFRLGDSNVDPRTPHQWSPLAGAWEPIAPYGLVKAVSSASYGEELVISSVGSGDPDLVYQRGYGTFPVNVTAGLNGQSDVNRYSLTNDNHTSILGVSRPTASGSGYICGRTVEIIDGISHWVGYILTPIPVTQP